MNRRKKKQNQNKKKTENGKQIFLKKKTCREANITFRSNNTIYQVNGKVHKSDVIPFAMAALRLMLLLFIFCYQAINELRVPNFNCTLTEATLKKYTSLFLGFSFILRILFSTAAFVTQHFESVESIDCIGVENCSLFCCRPQVCFVI